ncbi:MAG TPA: hypothetical protein VKM54_25670 [Myxococcota bacterium]|nr:hypothetical protein [Myxococcota bacterium]
MASGTHDPKQRTGIPAPRYRGARALAEPDLNALRSEGERRAGQRAYSTSKLCNVLCTYALDERMRAERPGITANAYDPGAVPGTGLVRDYGRIARFAAGKVLPHALPLLRLFLHAQSVEAAGAGLARLILDPSLDRVSGRYFAGTRETRSSDESYDEGKRRELFKESAGLVALSATEAAVSID